MIKIDVAKYFPFSTPRKGQFELIEKIINCFLSGKKHVILNAPTGWGKSVIAYTILNYFKEGYILTSQKCLQEQYLRDLNIPYIMGRKNYNCLKNSSLNCEMGVCKRNIKFFCNNCPYLVARDNALSSKISDLNYCYYLTIATRANLNNEFLLRKMLVCDECHNIESALLDLCSLKINTNLLNYLSIKTDFPKIEQNDLEKLNWLINEIYVKATSQKSYLKAEVEIFKDFKITKKFKSLSTKLLYVEKLITTITEINKQLKENSKIIINMENPESIEFKLLYADNLFNRYISSNAEYVLHMSATVLNKEEYCKSLGIDVNNAEYIQVDAIFPVKNRLIYYNPVGSLSYKNKIQTMPKLINRVNEILEKYNNVKGIIHTINYNIAETIINNLISKKQGYRLLMPRGENRLDVLNAFYTSTIPYVLISPSLTEGLDLKDDLSRFCIICKVPYANISDVWTKTRMSLSNNWYLTNAAQTLVQMTGRSIRSETDFCDTYILDEDFINFASRAITILPDWWKESVKELN